jgi:hypothetical protein
LGFGGSALGIGCGERGDDGRRIYGGDSLKRYRMKLVVPGVGLFARVFPNALTFVAWVRPEQAEFRVAAAGFLSAFGVRLEVEEA